MALPVPSDLHIASRFHSDGKSDGRYEDYSWVRNRGRELEVFADIFAGLDYLVQVLYTIDGALGDDAETPNAYVLTGFSADQVGKPE